MNLSFFATSPKMATFPFATTEWIPRQRAGCLAWRYPIAAFVLCVCLTGVASATTVFSDDFTTSQGATFSTSGSIGTSPWTVTRSGDDWGAQIDNDILGLTNDASATANANGWVFASVATSGFSAPWNSSLSSNPGLVTWNFNMRQIRTDPAGFSTGNYGVAFILGATSATAASAGNGYAVVLGNGLAGDPDPVRLVAYTGGIATLGTGTTGIITAPSPLSDVGVEYMSLRVTYNPATNGWELFGRNDGSTAFADPTSGTLTSLGTATNSTHTSVSLTSMGGYWQGSTAANQTAFFDNVSVAVVPEPSSVTLAGLGVALAGLCAWKRWQAAAKKQAGLGRLGQASVTGIWTGVYAMNVSCLRFRPPA